MFPLLVALIFLALRMHMEKQPGTEPRLAFSGQGDKTARGLQEKNQEQNENKQWRIILSKVMISINILYIIYIIIFWAMETLDVYLSPLNPHTVYEKEKKDWLLMYLLWMSVQKRNLKKLLFYVVFMFGEKRNGMHLFKHKLTLGIRERTGFLGGDCIFRFRKTKWLLFALNVLLCKDCNFYFFKENKNSP